MAIINPEWIIKQEGSFQTAEEMNTLAVAVKNNAIESQTDINNLSVHINNKSNPHEVTKIQLDLENVDNVSDINKPVSIAQAEAIAVVQTNLNNHKADVNNPHGVTKVQIGLSEVNNTSDINKPVSTAQASAIDIVQSDIDIHKLEVNNPHSVTKAQVGLGNVDDTSDVNKPISIAQHTAIDAVQDDLNIHKNNTNNPHNITKTQLGLSAVDNTADVNKPISIATQTALNLKVDKVRQIIAGNGLTGGGDLSTDRTLNVLSANDGITVNADNIQLNTIDNVTTPSITKPLSANQGKVLNDNLVQLGAELNENIEPALAEILNQQNKRIEALEDIIKKMLFKAGQFDTLEVVKEFNIYGKTNMIIPGTAAPSVIPDFLGQKFINSTGKVAYEAVGISSAADWKQTTN